MKGVMYFIPIYTMVQAPNTSGLGNWVLAPSTCSIGIGEIY